MRPSIALVIALQIGLAAGAAAQAPAETGPACVALTTPSVQGVDGSATEFGVAVRDLFASFLAIVIAGPAQAGRLVEAQRVLDACMVVSADEIRAALGRKDLTPGKPGRASGGYSDCRFAGAGAGDVRVTLSPVLKGAKEDFDLKTQIYAEEGERVEKISGIGDGAYYWDDTIEFRVGNRIVSVWVNRTPRTEAPAAVKSALTALAKRVAGRLSR